MKVKGYAKINLSLNVLGVKDGYHELESVVAQISLCDKIKMRKSHTVSVNYGKSFKISPEQDNAFKACKLFMEEFNTGGAEIRISKKIPPKAGVGGSSADAVGVICGMQRLYNIPDCEKLRQVLAKAGSDCTVQYVGGYSLMKGRGERVEKIPTDKKLYAVILTESKGVNTAECFALCDKSEPENIDNQAIINYLTNGGQMPRLGNALYLPAVQLNKKVQENINILKEYFSCVNMTGSGSAVYGITEDKKSAKKAYGRLKKKYSGAYFTKLG